MQNQPVVMASQDFNTTDMKVVVRRTFLDLDEYDEPEFAVDCKRGRERSFSDFEVNYGQSELPEDEECLDDSSSCESVKDVECSEQSTSAGSRQGDSTPTSGQRSPSGRCSPAPRWVDEMDDVPSGCATPTSETSAVEMQSTPVLFMNCWVAVPMCVASAPVPASSHSGPPGQWQTQAPQIAKPVVLEPATPDLDELSTKDDSRTTLMLKNLPSCFTRDSLIASLDSKGLEGHYDFLYLPIDFLSGAALGYAFVNFSTNEGARLAMDALGGFDGWKELLGSASTKVLEVVWSEPHQGMDMMVDRYRNSRVMHGSVPDAYRPMMLKDGVRIDFPRPTKRIRPPFSGGVVAK